MKRLTKFSLLLLLVPQLALANVSNFDCESFITQARVDSASIEDPLAETLQKFSGKEPELEEVLAWVARLLGPDGQSFIELVDKELKGEPIIRGPLGWPKRLRYLHEGVRYLRTPFNPNQVRDLNFLFEAIRTSFSKGIGDSPQWNNADAEQRFLLTVAIKERATLTLFYEYKLYKRLRTEFRDKLTPNLNSARDLEIPDRNLQRFLPPRGGATVFKQVRLLKELAERLDEMPEPSDRVILVAIEDFVSQNLTNRLNDFNSSKPGKIRAVAGIAALIAIGFVAFYTGRWSGSTPPIRDDKPALQKAYTDPNSEKAAVLQDPLDIQVKQLEDTAKARALTTEEQIILQGLLREQSSR